MNKTPKEPFQDKPVAVPAEPNEREKALALFKIDYKALVEKYGWDIGACLQVVDKEQGIVQPRVQYVNLRNVA